MTGARIRVTARRDGFRRAGRAWPAGGVELDAGDLAPGQLAALEAEPMLVVQHLAALEAGTTPLLIAGETVLSGGAPGNTDTEGGGDGTAREAPVLATAMEAPATPAAGASPAAGAAATAGDDAPGHVDGGSPAPVDAHTPEGAAATPRAGDPPAGGKKPSSRARKAVE